MKRGGLLLTSGTLALAAAASTAVAGWRAIGPAGDEPGMVAWMATVLPWVADLGQETA